MDPLSLTGGAFIEAARRSTKGGREAARRAYSAFYRTGRVEAATAGATIPEPRRVLREPSPEGEVVKFLLGIGGAARRPESGGLETESVLIPMIGRSGARTYTLCVSSQVGCAMGCTFCETAQMGLMRSLTRGEIVSQWFAARHVLGIAPKNVVFMGMGEPLDNLDEVVGAIEILKDHLGAGVPISQVTVSTVGRLDGLARLREKLHEVGWHRLNLAVSLNAPNDEVRSAIMPVNRAMPMAQLRRALEAWPVYGGGKICIEYVLIPGVNDRPGHAEEVAAFMDAFRAPTAEGTGGGTVEGGPGGPPRALINLIPYNPRRSSPWPAPSEDEVAAFMSRLMALGVYVKRRRTKGREMMGACGQLGNEHIRRRRFVGVTRESHATTLD